ncbi:MAG: hypothetical protein ACI9S8_000298 [Chlamydiales bacterium]|jgi:hypothetical protein
MSSNIEHKSVMDQTLEEIPPCGEYSKTMQGMSAGKK